MSHAKVSSLIVATVLALAGVANADAPCVFNHHGSAYAIVIEGTVSLDLARLGVQQYNEAFTEPFVRVQFHVFTQPTVSIDVDPTLSMAAFYHRLQFTGTASPDVWMPRIKILSLDDCRTK